VDVTTLPLLSDIKMVENLPRDTATYNDTVLKAMALKNCEFTKIVLLHADPGGRAV
jgi:hypothetical protein